MGNTNRISGDKGTPIIDEAGANTNLNYKGIKATEDTILSVCTGLDNNGNAVDFKAVMNWNGTLTVNHGSLMVERGYKITAITLTSGEIVCL